jgi:hypothetical protein
VFLAHKNPGPSNHIRVWQILEQFRRKILLFLINKITIRQLPIQDKATSIYSMLKIYRLHIISQRIIRVRNVKVNFVHSWQHRPFFKRDISLSSNLTDTCVNILEIVSKISPWLGIGVYYTICQVSGTNEKRLYNFATAVSESVICKISVFMLEFRMRLEIEVANWESSLLHI